MSLEGDLLRIIDAYTHPEYGVTSRLEAVGFIGLQQNPDHFLEGGDEYLSLEKDLYQSFTTLVANKGVVEDRGKTILGFGRRNYVKQYRTSLELPQVNGENYSATIRVVTDEKSLSSSTDFTLTDKDCVYLVIEPEGFDHPDGRGILRIGLSSTEPFNIGSNWVQIGQYAPVARMDLGDLKMLKKLAEKMS